MIGEKLDRKYEIVSLLGEGGMGSVFEARHLGTLQCVAIKLINRHKVGADGETTSRFRREARAAAEIDSPHVVRIRDFGEDEVTGHLYLVMEYLDGEDLQRLLDRVGLLSPDVALRVAGQVLAGLAEAHAAGIIHRDIKPANLFLARGRDGEVTMKVLDFGIAKAAADPRDGPHTTGLTETGTMMGTTLWMSPEQTQDSKDVDARTDVWSLGCVLYAALEGHAPHHQHRDATGRLINTICNVPAPSLRERAPWVPKKVAKVVHRALAIDPGQRYEDAGVMLKAIRALTPEGCALREEMLVGLGPEQRATRPRLARWRRGLTVGAAAVAISGTMGYWFTRTHVSQTSTPAVPPVPALVAAERDGAGAPTAAEASPPAAAVMRIGSAVPSEVGTRTGGVASGFPGGARAWPAPAPASSTVPASAPTRIRPTSGASASSPAAPSAAEPMKPAQPSHGGAASGPPPPASAEPSRVPASPLTPRGGDLD